MKKPIQKRALKTRAKILEALEKLDEMNTQIEATQKVAAKAREEADRVSREIRDEEPHIREDIERLGGELKQCETDLPGEFRELYRRVVRHRGEDALAPIQGEFCQGCNQHVPVNLINQLLLNHPTTIPLNYAFFE